MGSANSHQHVSEGDIHGDSRGVRQIRAGSESPLDEVSARPDRQAQQGLSGGGGAGRWPLRPAAGQGNVNDTGAGSPAVASTSAVLVVPAAGVTAMVKRPDGAVLSLLNPSGLPAENWARIAAVAGTV
jgi:hypothetical protein